MKRENFLITSTEGHEVIKYKWNSSNRAVEDIIREIARSEGTYWELVDSQSNKEGKYHICGTRTWKRSVDGKEIVFTITKV